MKEKMKYLFCVLCKRFWYLFFIAMFAPTKKIEKFLINVYFSVLILILRILLKYLLSFVTQINLTVQYNSVIDNSKVRLRINLYAISQSRLNKPLTIIYNPGSCYVYLADIRT